MFEGSFLACFYPINHGKNVSLCLRIKHKIAKTNNQEYFIIPNPIYDVVFKFLMEDLESARIFLETLLNEKIIHLEFAPVSHASKIAEAEEKEPEIRLFHLDFTAILELAGGKRELVMIELQKANVPGDIFRFKRYISANFQKKQQKEIIDPHTQAVETIEQPVRLLPIFILNFRIEKEVNDLLIKTNRVKLGIFKNRTLQEENEFIDNLSYDLWVVQLPNLSNIQPEDYANDDYKRRVYLLLKLFDQDSQQAENRHRLRLIKALFPDFLNRVINRLKAADASEPDLEEQMYVEDEYLAELRRRANKISFFQQALQQKTEELEQERQLSQQKDAVICDFARMLKSSGASVEEIEEKMGLSKDEIERL